MSLQYHPPLKASPVRTLQPEPIEGHELPLLLGIPFTLLLSSRSALNGCSHQDLKRKNNRYKHEQMD